MCPKSGVLALSRGGRQGVMTTSKQALIYMSTSIITLKIVHALVQ